MDNSEILWKQFTASGKVCDYLAYCSVKDGNNSDNKEGTSDIRRISGKRNECRGE